MCSAVMHICLQESFYNKIFYIRLTLRTCMFIYVLRIGQWRMLIISKIFAKNLFFPLRHVIKANDHAHGDISLVRNAVIGALRWSFVKNA